MSKVMALTLTSKKRHSVKARTIRTSIATHRRATYFTSEVAVVFSLVISPTLPSESAWYRLLRKLFQFSPQKIMVVLDIRSLV